MIRGARADVDEVVSGEVRETLDPEILLAEVATDQARVGLTYFDERCTRLVMRHASNVEAAVFSAMSKYGNVEHRLFCYRRK